MVLLGHYIYAGAQPEMFQGQGGFVKLGHYDFVKNSRKKKVPQGKILKVFLLDTLKTTF